MSHAVSLDSVQSKSSDASVDAIAKETDTSVDLVKTLYEQECTALEVQAKVKTFIGVIASRNVKRHLRAIGIAH